MLVKTCLQHYGCDMYLPPILLAGSFRFWFVKKYYWLVCVREKYCSGWKFTIVYDKHKPNEQAVIYQFLPHFDTYCTFAHVICQLSPASSRSLLSFVGSLRLRLHLFLQWIDIVRCYYDTSASAFYIDCSYTLADAPSLPHELFLMVVDHRSLTANASLLPISMVSKTIIFLEIDS